MKITFDDKKFNREMKNLISYANGFIEGAQAAKPEMMNILGTRVADVLGQYVDSISRANPYAMHHVYEWAQTGSPTARLFDIGYTVSGGGLSMSATFTQSQSVQAGSSTPFYDKARIMEAGIPVKISPKNSQVLAFNDNGEQVFTKKPVVVNKPGGQAVEGQFESNFENFFSIYLSQSIFDVTGFDHLKSSRVFKDNIRRGVSGGRSVGLTTGRRWITGSKI